MPLLNTLHSNCSNLKKNWPQERTLWWTQSGGSLTSPQWEPTTGWQSEWVLLLFGQRLSHTPYPLWPLLHTTINPSCYTSSVRSYYSTWIYNLMCRLFRKQTMDNVSPTCLNVCAELVQPPVISNLLFFNTVIAGLLECFELKCCLYKYMHKVVLIKLIWITEAITIHLFRKVLLHSRFN